MLTYVTAAVGIGVRTFIVTAIAVIWEPWWLLLLPASTLACVSVYACVCVSVCACLCGCLCVLPISDTVVCMSLSSSSSRLCRHLDCVFVIIILVSIISSSQWCVVVSSPLVLPCRVVPCHLGVMSYAVMTTGV